MRFLPENLLNCAPYHVNASTEFHLNDEKLDIGSMTRKLLKTMIESQQKEFYRGVHNFFKVLTTYLQGKFDLKNSLAYHFRFLNPRLRRTGSLLESVVFVSEHLPPHCGLKPCDTDTVKMEWRQYALEEIPKDWSVKSDALGKDHHIRIDEYWSKVMEMKKESGELKFPILSIVVKACLAAVAGNAATERTFNELAHFIRKDRNRLSEVTVSSLMTVKSHLQAYDTSCYEYPINKSLLSAVKDSYKKCQERQRKLQAAEVSKKKKDEEARRQRDFLMQLKEAKEKERKKKSLDEAEKSLREKEDEAKMKQKEAEEMIKKAQTMLKESSSLHKKCCIQNQKVQNERNKFVNDLLQMKAKQLLKQSRATLHKRSFEGTSDGPDPKKKK